MKPISTAATTAIGLICLALFLGATPDDERVSAEATVIRYVPNAMHWDYTDGGWDTWSGVELKMTAPKEWQGTNVTIYLSHGNTNTLFKTAGTKWSFKIDRKYLVQDSGDAEKPDISVHVPFDGDLVGLREIKTHFEPAGGSFGDRSALPVDGR